MEDPEALVVDSMLEHQPVQAKRKTYSPTWGHLAMCVEIVLLAVLLVICGQCVVSPHGDCWKKELFAALLFSIWVYGWLLVSKDSFAREHILFRYNVRRCFGCETHQPLVGEDPQDL